MRVSLSPRPAAGSRCRGTLPATMFLTISAATALAVTQESDTSPARPASFERVESRNTPRAARFGRHDPQVGDQIDQLVTLDLRLDTTVRQGGKLVEQNATSMRRQQRRLVTTTEVTGDRATAVRVRYLAASTGSAQGQQARNAISQPTSQAPQPVEGKVYDCRRDGERLIVTDDRGDIPPMDEYRIVAENMEALGKANPLTEFLVGRTVTVGERITLPHEVAERLLGIGDRLGEVTQFVLTLRDVRRENGAAYAEFQASVEAASNHSSQMRLQVEGPLVIQVDTCRAVAADLVGPIGMVETRGSLNHTYQMTGTGRMSARIASTYHDVER